MFVVSYLLLMHNVSIGTRLCSWNLAVGKCNQNECLIFWIKESIIPCLKLHASDCRTQWFLSRFIVVDPFTAHKTIADPSFFSVFLGLFKYLFDYCLVKSAATFTLSNRYSSQLLTLNCKHLSFLCLKKFI